MVDVSKWSPQNDWENPAIYERNRARMHVPLRSYRSKDAAVRYFSDGPNAPEKPAVISLNSTNGRWKFKLFDRPEEVTPEFWSPEFDDNDWGKVRVLKHATSGVKVTSDN